MSLSIPLLFKTSPSDCFHLFDQKAVVNGQKVVELLKYKKEDVAVATNIPLSSIRYEQKRIPEELREHLTQWATALNLVAEFFHDEKKTIIWCFMPNPLLGGMTPRDMIRVGRFKKLLNFIQTALDENHRENVDEKK
jgi:uncharacterized protein (DUF2384 family)